ncbi:MAG: Ig-like domain-containing protein [Clostridiaceae bacterium]|nr:Ig-like domain-containing protein [Clostridiaceae bacterium]
MRGIYGKRMLALTAALMLLIGLCGGAYAEEAVVNTAGYRTQAVMIADAKSLCGIVAAALPETGKLTIGGRLLMRGEGVSLGDFDRLVYQPLSGTEDRFSYYPIYTDGRVGELVTITLEAVSNTAPIARTVSLETYRNMSIGAKVCGVDPDGDAFSAAIVTEPACGVVELDAETGTFLYTPYQNRTGTDSFTYVLTDECGASSAQTEVTIKVYRPQSGLEYADMSGSAAHYAAVRLAELGIYEGAKIGGVSYLEPDAVLTRGELIAMAVALAGDEPIPVVNTSFADDDCIPAWAKPFAAAAQKTGYIAGETTPDGVILRTDEPVTRAEAAVILCAAAGLGNAAPTGSFADEEAIPAWAMADASNAAELGLLELMEDGSFDAAGTLTREEGLSAVFKAYQVMQENVVKTGFFSWVL